MSKNTKTDRTATIKATAEKRKKATKATKTPKAKTTKEPKAKRVANPNRETAHITPNLDNYVRTTVEVDGKKKSLIDCGDATAEFLRNHPIEDLYTMAAAVKGVTVEEMEAKYVHVNHGQKCMNLRNIIRGFIKGVLDNEIPEGYTAKKLVHEAEHMRKEEEKEKAAKKAAAEKAKAAKKEAKAAKKEAKVDEKKAA